MYENIHGLDSNIGATGIQSRVEKYLVLVQTLACTFFNDIILLYFNAVYQSRSQEAVTSQSVCTRGMRGWCLRVVWGDNIFTVGPGQDTASVSAQQKQSSRMDLVILTIYLTGYQHLSPTPPTQQYKIFSVYMIGLISPLVIFYSYRNCSCWFVVFSIQNEKLGFNFLSSVGGERTRYWRKPNLSEQKLRMSTGRGTRLPSHGQFS